MRKFVIGDIHGQLKNLKTVFKMSNFDFDNDILYSLGDLCDRGKSSKSVIDLLMKVKNLKLCIGNHDVFFVEWLMYQHIPIQWLELGGQATINSFKNVKNLTKYINFYRQARVYHIDECGNFFAHGGMPSDLKDSLYEFIWDRSFAYSIINSVKINHNFTEVFLGHTFVKEPVCFNRVWLLDTGACYNHKLTMMNIETKEIFQS